LFPLEAFPNPIRVVALVDITELVPEPMIAA